MPKWSRAWEEKAGWVLTIATREDIGTHIDVAYSKFGHQCFPNLMVGAPVSGITSEWLLSGGWAREGSWVFGSLQGSEI